MYFNSYLDRMLHFASGIFMVVTLQSFIKNNLVVIGIIILFFIVGLVINYIRDLKANN